MRRGHGGVREGSRRLAFAGRRIDPGLGEEILRRAGHGRVEIAIRTQHGFARFIPAEPALGVIG